MKLTNNRMWVALLLCLAIAHVAYTAANNEILLTNDLVQHLANLHRSAVVSLIAVGTDTEHNAAAVIIDPKGIAVTVADGLLPTQNLSVHYEDGSTARAVIVAIDHRTDVAVLKLENAKKVPYAVLGESARLHNGDPLLVMGVPDSDGVSIVKNTVRDVLLDESGRRYITMVASTAPILNGAPVFDPKGNLVALIANGPDPTTEWQAIPINVLFGPLDQLRISSPSKRLVERGKREKQKKEKLALFEAAVRADPLNSSAYFYLAVVHGDMDDDKKQLAALKRFAELRPESFQAHRNLGLVLMDSNQLDLAVTHLRKAANLRPETARVHNDLGEVYRRKKMYAQAIKELETALKLDPNLPEAHFNIGLIIATVHNNAAAAAKHFQKYLDLRPGTPDAGKLRKWMNNSLSNARTDSAP